MDAPSSYGIYGPGLSGVAAILAGGAIIWGLLFTLVFNSRLADSLATKHYNGPVAAKVEATDRCLAFVHAIVSGSFGIYAWTAVPLGRCSYDAGEEQTMRIGVATTMSFLMYDFALLVVAEAILRLRDTSKAMWLHHINILPFFFFGVYHNQVTWFMCANLINEVSTVPLHITFFMHAHGRSNNILFIVMGGILVLTFLVLRVVAIVIIAYYFYLQKSCVGEGSPAHLAVISWITVSIHWILNSFWYWKIMQLIVKRKISRDDGPRESVPLIATEAGLGPTPPEDMAN